jgi:hypothetical protein
LRLRDRAAPIAVPGPRTKCTPRHSAWSMHIETA